MLKPLSKLAPIVPNIFDDDDVDGWQEMPVVRASDPNLALDEEDQKKYHYVVPSGRLATEGRNATGNLIDFDDMGNEWREKLEADEEEYTRLRLDDDDDADEAYLRTRYLFDEDKAMTPLSQMQATKDLLTEAQRIAYVGLVSLVARKMLQMLQQSRRKEVNLAIKAMDLWRLRILGRLFYHMELETEEQKMIESLAEHGVDPMDLVPSLLTTHTVANPEYDPAEARKKQVEESRHADSASPENSPPTLPASPTSPFPHGLEGQPKEHSMLRPGQSVLSQTTANIMQPNQATSVPGVSTTLSSTDENVTLDIRWTVLCDLFLILIADSVYDARSRTLLENVASRLGLGWLEVVRFEKRVTDALEIQEGVEQMKHQEIIEGREKSARKKRYVMVGLATIGGGLVIGLSAGLLAPVIGAGIGAALTTVGVTGTAGFLGGVGGAAAITTGGVLTGSGIAARGMSRRTQQVRTFDLLPLHNNKRVSCIITVPGFMAGPRDDVRLPFSVLDPLVGDVFSVRWEPEMMGETGNALKLLTAEVLSQVGQTVLQATVMTALMSALQWPIVLTKLGYLIDNPWSNALDRAKAAGFVLADILMNRSLGVRPITLMGFSLGARVIFFALLELAKQKAFGIVQDVFFFGATVTAPMQSWFEVRGVVSGRFVNCYACNDWILNYLFRATSGGGTVAGLRPIEGVPGLENVDVTDKISGHLSYRIYMPVILDQLGFPVTATYFDEPEEPDMTQDRIVMREAAEMTAAKNRSGLLENKSETVTSETPPKLESTPLPPSIPSTSSSTPVPSGDDDLPERVEHPSTSTKVTSSLSPIPDPKIPAKAGFDFQAIGKALGKGDDFNPEHIPTVVLAPKPQPSGAPTSAPSLGRSESAPPPLTQDPSPLATPKVKPRDLDHLSEEASQAGTLPSMEELRQNFTRSMSFEVSSQRDEPDLQGTSTSYTSSLPKPQESWLPGNRATPSWPPASSLLSFASSDGTVWAPNKETASSPQYASRFTERGSSSGSFSDLEPSISFGSVDGSVSSYDTGTRVDRDPWAPMPIGLAAAIANKTSYTMNPWEK
ncbi:uncharacterized protein EI90DRAFT_2912015 [Cantharellus anzutake]|uniref:uncharacterized protein n=1 Tax=Cantharellus anzutake TaxID=1750568 RepID=UPI001905E24C|nr:uncharacterized protein EI90DRAFT_2912015 [Cantharellus anzutake]KAF8336458.1 hypothetical protein EI90DRAFT_2912015 [Cantharellus anzutake]